MEDSRAAVAALLFVALIVGINAMMYGIVRGIMRGGKNNPFETMMRAINPAQKKKDAEMQELRRFVEKLDKEGKERNQDNE